MSAVVCRVVRAAGRCALRLVVMAAIVVLLAIGIGPFTGRYRVATVLSGSMRPNMPAGALAVSTPERLDQLRVGQVISFQSPVGAHEIVTHRVVKIVARGAHPRVRTKGDANSSSDPWIAQLSRGPVWRVRMTVPELGSAIRMLRAPWIHDVTVVGAPLALLAACLWSIWLPAPRHRRRSRAPVFARS
jgi:signal peptidase